MPIASAAPWLVETVHPLQTMATAVAGSQMLELSEISAVGKRTGAMDRLYAKGMNIGSKVFHDVSRGTYSISEVTTGDGQAIALKLHFKVIDMPQLWQLLAHPEVTEVPEVELAFASKSKAIAKPQA